MPGARASWSEIKRIKLNIGIKPISLHLTTYLCHPTFTDKKVCWPLVAIWLVNSWSQKCDNFPAIFTDQVRLGYLDVAIAKNIRKTPMPSCAIDSWQRLFRCSHCEKKILSVKLDKKFENLSVKLTKTVARIFRQWKSGCTNILPNAGTNFAQISNGANLWS